MNLLIRMFCIQNLPHEYFELRFFVSSTHFLCQIETLCMSLSLTQECSFLRKLLPCQLPSSFLTSLVFFLNSLLNSSLTSFFFTDSNFVLGNAQVPNLYPIVYCSDGFCELTGYPRAQIMQKGCACSFLFGPETTDDHKKEIEQALETKSELKLEVTFYRSNGESLFVA